MRLATKAMASLALGALLAPCFIWTWAQIAGRSFFLRSAMQLGLQGNPLFAVVTFLDFLTNIVLFLPAAWILCKFLYERLMLHVALTAFGLFVFSSILIGIPSMSFGVLGIWPYINIVLFYLALPIAVWSVKKLVRRT